MMKKPYQKYCEAEDAVILQMKGQGKTTREIAIKLGRTQNSITSRITGKFRKRTDILPPPAPTMVAIHKHQVVDMYELGWRFIKPAGDMFLFVWPHQDTPLYPQFVEIRQAAE